MKTTNICQKEKRDFDYKTVETTVLIPYVIV